jgi:DUF1680 family protein
VHHGSVSSWKETVMFEPLPRAAVELRDAYFRKKVDANRAYLLALRSEDLLQNFYLEAGLWSTQDMPERCHAGWEAPTCQLRGHFLGHWLSAAARRCSVVKDPELKGKADFIVSELGRCQRENGGQWAGSIPEKYMHWMARGKAVWAPHYTTHKTFMGLLDVAVLGGSDQALQIADAWADWFLAWCSGFDRERMDAILEYETGGMLEVWAELLHLTGKPKYEELLERYDRRRLFEPLRSGTDVLTNMHANTTIPEILGAARAFEVTGDRRFRDVVEAYWRSAVTGRGAFVTGGQTAGEIWTPPGEQAARLGARNQEHCTVYNMMRLAERLLRWAGAAEYADYWERNLWNGIAAQGHWEEFHQSQVSTNRYPARRLVAYFVGLEPGARKRWGSETGHFWCCHGTLVQANASHTEGIYYVGDGAIALCQWIASRAVIEGTPSASGRHGTGEIPRTEITQELDPQLSSLHTPRSLEVRIAIGCEAPAEFDLLLRLPGWLAGPARVRLNGTLVEHHQPAGSFLTLRRRWSRDTVELSLPRGISVSALPDRPELVAFSDGPVALAGLCSADEPLIGDRKAPETILVEDDERDWATWKRSYRARTGGGSIRFVPLHQIGDEPYTVYFPVTARAAP